MVHPEAGDSRVSGVNPSTFSDSNTNELRLFLKETVFRGRGECAVNRKRYESSEVSSENCSREESAVVHPTIPGDTLLAIQEQHKDVKWERTCLILDDKRDPTQCNLNLHLAKSSKIPANTCLPTVCILHGTGNSFDVQEVLDNAIRFVQRGFLVVLLNSRYHGCRKGPGYLGKERYLEALIEAWKTNSSEDTRRNLYPFIYDTAADLSTVADYLLTRPDVNDQQLGITGISLGGMHAWFAAAIDTRWSAVAPLIGVQSFKYAVDESCYEARVATIQDLFDTAAKDLGQNQVTCDVVKAVWHRICPGLLDQFDGGKSLALLSPRPAFIANGELDPRCPAKGVKEAVELARKAYERDCGEPGRLQLRIYESVGHEVTGEMWDDCIRFFEREFGVGESNDSAKGSEAAQQVADMQLCTAVGDKLGNQRGI